MAKRKKPKNNGILIVCIVLFFIAYIFIFNLYSNREQGEGTKIINIEEKQDTRSLLKQLKDENKIYISDKSISNVRMEDEKVEDFKYSFIEFSKIRKPESYNPIYEGYTDSGMKFSTDLNVFRIYTVNKEEYYKVPVSYKDTFKEILDTSVYTSFDFIKQYKTWKKVSIKYDDKNKSIRSWNYEDLSSKMVKKRLVGKIQPQKARERCKYKFDIEIKAEDYEAKINIMGEDYIKISVNGLVSYYEVTNNLYSYVKDEVFKIKD